MISKENVLHVSREDLLRYDKEQLVQLFLDNLDELDHIENKLDILELRYNSVFKAYQVLNEQYSNLIDNINCLESWY